MLRKSSILAVLILLGASRGALGRDPCEVGQAAVAGNLASVMESNPQPSTKVGGVEVTEIGGIASKEHIAEIATLFAEHEGPLLFGSSAGATPLTAKEIRDGVAAFRGEVDAYLAELLKDPAFRKAVGDFLVAYVNHPPAHGEENHLPGWGRDTYRDNTGKVIEDFQDPEIAHWTELYDERYARVRRTVDNTLTGVLQLEEVINDRTPDPQGRANTVRATYVIRAFLREMAHHVGSANEPAPSLAIDMNLSK